MKRNVLKSHLLAGVLSLASVFSAQALDVKSGDVIAFGGDEIVQDALSRDTGFAKLVMSGLAANGISATAANFGSEAYSAFEFSYEALEDMLAQKPKAAVVCLGIRDIRDGSKPFSGPTGFGISISNVIERCQAEGVRLVLVTPPVWPEENLSSANNVKLLDYVNLMKAAAAHYGVSCYDFNADERAYLAAHPASSSNRQLTSDGLKPNARGGQMAARGILRALGATDANVTAAEAAWAEIKSGTTVTLKLSERQLRTIIQAAKNAGQYKETDYLPETKAYVLGLIRQSQSVPKVDPYPMTKVPGCYDAPANKTYSYQSGQKIVLIGDSISHMARDHACGYDKLLKWGLEAAGFSNVVVDNQGRSGDTSSGMLERVNISGAKYLVLQDGVNDAQDGNPNQYHTIEKFTANMNAFAEKCKAAGVEMIMMTPTVNGEASWQLTRHKPSMYIQSDIAPTIRSVAKSYGLPMIELWDRWHAFRKNCEQNGYVNVPETLLRFGRLSQHEFFVYDGTHVYWEGYRDMARRILRALGVPESKMSDVEEAWLDKPNLFDMSIGLSVDADEMVSAGAAAMNMTAAEYVRDVILFPVGKANSWTTEPSISKTTWKDNETAGTLSFGAAAHGTVTCNYTQAQLNALGEGVYTVKFSVAADGEYAGLSKSIVVTVTSSAAVNSWTTEPSLSKTSWKEGQAGTISMGAALYGEVKCNYTQQELNGLPEGSYTVKFTVAGVAKQYTGLEKTISVTVSSSQAANAWKTEPSVTPAKWCEGETAGVLSLGEAEYGTVTCDYTQAQLNALTKGSYTLTFTVAAKANEYKGLTKTLTVRVMTAGGGETPVLDESSNLVYKDTAALADAGNETVGSQVTPTDCKVGYAANQAVGMATGGHCLWVENSDVTLLNGTYLFNEFELVKTGTSVPVLTVGEGATLKVRGKNGDLEHASQGTTSPTLLRAEAGGAISLDAASVIVDQGRAAAMSVELDGGSLTLANQVGNSGAAFGSLTVKNGGSFTQGGNSQGYLIRSGAGSVTVDNGTMKIAQQFGIWTDSSALTVKGANAKITCGSFDHDGANTLKFVIPSAGWAAAPFEATGTGGGYATGAIAFKSADKAKFVVDATGYAVAANATVKVPLMTAAGSLTLNLANLVTAPVVTCASGVTGKLVVEGKTLYAQLTAGSSPDQPTVPPAENSWTTEPSLSATTWTAGDAVTINKGAAKSGGTVTCNYTEAQLKALAAGSYTVKFTVAATDAWTGLEKTIGVTVKAKQADPEPTYTFVTTEADLRVKDGAKCLLVGDSIMAYGGSYGYAPLTRKYLEKIGVSISKWDLNGAGGRSTDHLIDETSNCYLPNLLKGQGYDFVFIQIGINDQNAGRSWEVYTQRLNWIFQTIIDAGATPVLIGNCSNNTDSPGGWTGLQKSYCANHSPVILYADCAKYQTEAYKVDKIRNSGDGIHPNYYGYRWMAWAMCKALGAKDADKETAIAFFDDFYRSVMYFSVDFLDADVYGRAPLCASQSIFNGECATAPAEPSHDDVTFVGWSPDGGVNVYSSAEVNKRAVTGPVAYTAVYKTGKEERDTSGTTYTWKGGASGDWRTKSNWDMTAAGVLGYPDHETFATAVFTSGASVDLGGTTNALVKLTLPDSGTVTLKNGGVRVDSPKDLLEKAKHLALDNCTLYCIDQNADLFGSTTAHMTLDLSNGAYFNGKGYMWNYSSGNDVNAFNSLGGDNRVRDIWLRSGKCGVTVKSGSLATTGGYGFYVESGTMTVGTDSGTFKPHKVDVKGGTIVFNAKLGASPKPVLDATGKTANFSNAKVTFNVDASAVTANGTYPIAVAQTLTFGSGKLTLSVTGQASGCTATLKQNGNQIELVVTGGGDPVTPAENSWNPEPSISKTSWTEGDTAGTLSLGGAKYGTVTCNYTQAQLNALTKGTYTVKFTVAAKAGEYTGLEKSVSITVNAKQTDPVVPAMEGRVISEVTAEGATVKFDLGAGANDVALWVAGGATDRGEDFEGWAAAGEAKFVKIVAKGNAVSGESVNLATYGLSNAKVVRLFTRPAYDATLTGLVGSRTAANVGSYIDTLGTPNLTDKLVADVTAPRLSGGDYETIFSARKDNAANDRTMTAFIKHNQGNSTFRIDYGAYTGTSAYKTESSAYTAAGTRYEVTLNANQASVTPNLLAETPVKSEAETADAGGTLLLFATRAQTASGVVANHLGKFTLHSFKWYAADGTLKHDYVPVRVANGVKALYDRKLGMVLTPSKAGAAEDFGGEDATPVSGSLTFSEAITLTEQPVTPEENSWTTEPSLSATTWTEGDAVTINKGAAKSGGTVTCNYTEAQLKALAKGTYTVKFTVAATDAWTGLEKTISVTVNEKQGGGEEPSGEGETPVLDENSNLVYKDTTVTADAASETVGSQVSPTDCKVAYAATQANGMATGGHCLWVENSDVTLLNGTYLFNEFELVKTGETVPTLTVGDGATLNVKGKNGDLEHASQGTTSPTLLRVEAGGAINLAAASVIVDQGRAAAMSVEVDGGSLTLANQVANQGAAFGALTVKNGGAFTQNGNAQGYLIRSGKGTVTVDNGTLSINQQFGIWTDSSELTVKGANAKITCGSFDHDGANTIKFVIPSAGWAAAPFEAKGSGSGYATGAIAFKSADKAKFVVDATGYAVAANATVKVPLMTAVGSLTLNLANLVTAPVVTCASGIKGELVVEGNTLYAQLTAGDSPEPPVVEPAENSWTTEPSISKTSWTEGEAAGTLDFGEAKYGTVTCNYTQEGLNALTKGTYTVTFTVAATDAWTGLEKTIGVTVNAKQGGGEEPSSGSVTLTCSNYKGTETLANFPMLVRLSEESIPGFSYEGLDASLILFKDASGNELPCDVDTWNPGGESLVWVKVPSLAATTAVTLHWGKKRTKSTADVWTAYDGVWHFNEQSGTTFADSKGTYGAASVAVPGTETHVSCSIGPQKLGCGVALVNDGVKREGNMLATESRTLSGAITVSGWYQVTKLRDSTSDTYPNLIRGGAWQGGGFYLQCGTTGDNKSFTLVANADQVNLNQNPETVLGGGLHHVAVSVGSDGSKLYIDGIKKCSSASARLSSWTGKFNLLASVRSAAADEVRVQPTVASPDWIAADYQQQASADGVLYAVGAEPPVVEPTINPSTGSSSLEVEANDAESAKKLVVINPPEGSDISRADYAAYFTRRATNVGEGKWLVRVELDETVVRPELAETEDDTAAFEIGAEGGLIRVGNVKPGLYYGYVTAESLQDMATAKPVMQTEPAKSSATLVMPLPKTSDSAGFYRIVVRERSGD